MKNICLLTVALLSLALAGGCAKGGNGQGSGITVTITGSSVLYPNQAVTYTATVKPAGTSQTVTWSVQGNQCTGTPNACGTINATTGAYVAPATVPSPAGFQVVAASAADNTAVGTLGVSVQLIAVVVTPSSVTVGENLEQQFTAIATPDQAPQTFSWTCTPTGACGQLVQDPNISGLAVYTAPASNGGVDVIATSTVPNQPSASKGDAKVNVAASRFPAATYAFQFSGYDNSGNPVAAAGSFVLAANGSITDGVEDVLNASGPHQYAISSVSYAHSSGNNSNNLGTLTVALAGGPTTTYTAVLASGGSIQMIDSAGTGHGIMQKSAANTVFNAGPQTFAFGLTGVDKATGGNRVGYVGLLPMDGNGNIASGQLDSNDNGSATTVCATAPCPVTGSYSEPDVGLPTWWQMIFKSGAITQHFDFFVASGTAQSKTGTGDLTLFAISTDPVSATQPALAGTMLYQVPMSSGYNNAAFCPSGASSSGCPSISALTGANANVALINGITDGTSGGTGGAGNFNGNFDQNNNGTILSVGISGTLANGFPYTYVATPVPSGSSTLIGRYTFQMLGNPNASPVVPPLPFALYASGANRGFLLDQSSNAVFAGAMYPQPLKDVDLYAPAALPGTFAVATSSSSSSSIAPFVQNLLLTSPGGGVFNVKGVQNPGNATVTGTYTILSNGTGAITLTAPSASSSVIYAIDFDSTNSAIVDFFMMGTTSGTPSALAFAQE